MRYKNFILSLCIGLLIVGTVPAFAHAQSNGANGNLTYTQLEPLPGENGTQANFCQLLNFLFKALIYLGGMIAVLFLVLGGISFMVSEVVDKRTRAKERIKAAVWGLVLLLASWLILNTINPQLINACHLLDPAGTSSTSAAQTQTSQNQASQAAVDCRNQGGDTKIVSVSDTSANQDPCAGQTGLTCTGKFCVTIVNYTSCTVIVPTDMQGNALICLK